ncbi:threonine aldolase family protein [Spirochaeta dissipatitropha]
MSQIYSFKNDYSEGAHPEVLDAIIRNNAVQADGYGTDIWSDEARKMIREHIAMADADIHFVSGGTQANLTVISSLLRPHEAVIAADTGHIAVHETGAIEATGHKIITVPAADGKLRSSDIITVIEEHTDEHMVKPRLVFISNSTELGSVYSRQELQDLSHTCRELCLLLYMDGARLASALCSVSNDLSMSDIASLVDVFYIGGTKNGILAGEAIVLCKPDLQKDFRYFMKQKGALLAKGSLFGIQFRTLFSGDLYYSMARHANLQSRKLAEGIKKEGYSFLFPPESNQIFPVFPDYVIEKLLQDYSFYVWQKIGEQTEADMKSVSSLSAVRLVSSWATPDDAVAGFLDKLRNLRD